MNQPKKRKFNISSRGQGRQEGLTDNSDSANESNSATEPADLDIVERPQRLNMKQKTETGRRLNDEIYLPISQKDIVLNHMLIDPEDLYVGSYNRREQSLLSSKDPSLKKLIESIASEKQRDPILVRKVDGKDGWELVYGSRRLFSIKEINKTRKVNGEDTLKVRCWVSVMSDSDAEHLSASENNDREDISIYERALYFKRLYEDGSTVEIISAKEKVGISTVKDGIRIACIDLAFVKMLPSPKDVARTSGLQIMKAIEKAGKDKTLEFLEGHAGVVFEQMADLQKAFQSFITPVVLSSRADRQAKEFYTSLDDKKLKAKVIKHRTREGQYKLDLYDMTEKQIGKIYSLLEKL